MTELTALSIADAHAGLTRREFTARELAEAYLSEMEAARGLNSYVLETPEHARAQAAEADVRLSRGEAGPLEGIPIGVKDLFCTDGVRTTACSRILGSFVPPYESTVT